MFLRSRFSSLQRRSMSSVPVLEMLEERHAPACTATLPSTQLLIVCDGAADNVILDHAGTNTLVTLNGQPTGPWLDSRVSSILITLGGGNDTATVLANARAIEINGGAGTNNVVNLGNQTGLQSIRANVNVRSLQGFVALTANDAPSPVPRNVGLGLSALTGLAPANITFVALELASLTIRGGGGGNIFTVQNGPRANTTLFAGAGMDVVRVQGSSEGVALTVNTQGGNDTVQVGSANNTLGTVLGPVTVRGQTGNDRLLVHDQGTTAGQNYTLSPRSLTRPGMGLLTYETLDTLDIQASGGPDNFTVIGTAVGTRTAIFGNGGDEHFAVGTPNSSLDNIDGPLRFVGGLGRNQVTISDIAAIGDQTYTIEVGIFDRLLGAEPITLDGISVWFFVASAGNDWVRILTFDPSVMVTLDLAAGNDLLYGPDITNDWRFTALGSGSLNVTTTFLNVENIGGGVGEDTFNFGNGLAGQGVLGYLDGGAGTSTLDYSDWTTGALVELNNFYAAGAGAVYNMNKVIGGSGDDYLHGDAADNWLIGNNGRDILIGDEGADLLEGGNGRDLVFGGGGADWLEGGGDEDLLIDGYTSYDNDAFALDQIWNEWTRLDVGYLARIDNLRFGTGMSSYLLDGNNVLNDTLFEYLFGGVGNLDWFWGDAFDPQDQEAGEVVN